MVFPAKNRCQASVQYIAISSASQILHVIKGIHHAIFKLIREFDAFSSEFCQIYHKDTCQKDVYLFLN